ncbi:hypothetical protein JCM10213_006859 [Rhodosporidiobolus nylandii]
MLPDFDRSVLLPLTARDCAIGGIGLSVAFALDAKEGDLDVEQLEAAVARVVEGWRFLAGRVVFRKELGTYAVLAPLGPLPPNHKACSFTVSSTPSKKSPFSNLPPLASSTGHRIPFPAVSLIKPASVPSSLAAYAKSEHPITAWHVSIFEDTTIVGLSVPHGCFDATGLGLVVKALDAELHGKEIGWTGAWPPSNIARLVANGAFESMWHKAEDGCVFVGKDLLADLVKEIKDKVQMESGGQEYVSEGDVLVNWFYKAVYQHDPSPPGSFFASCAVSLRELVATPGMQLDLYPHNAVSGYSLNSSSPQTVATFLSTPLWQLALAHRRMLNASRTLPAVQRLLEWIETKTTPSWPALPEADCGWINPLAQRETTGYWIYSNQLAANMTSISFPSAATGVKLPLKAFLELGTSLDQFVTVNALDEGWIFGATMRRKRWDSVERTVRELEAQRK